MANLLADHQSPTSNNGCPLARSPVTNTPAVLREITLGQNYSCQ
jgi:hypothetical protein